MAAPKENKNAEKWTEKEANDLFSSAIELSTDDDYDFIGEIARDLNTYRDIFTYLSDKFPKLKDQYNKVLSNLEANCFSHSKKGTINTAVGIVNLKSNYGWTDRQQTDHTSGGEKINLTPIQFVSTKDK